MIILKDKEISNHYAMNKYSVVCQLHIKKKKENIEKEIRFVITRDKGWLEEKLGEGSKKLHSSSYKLNKYSECNVQHNKYN